MQPLQDGINLHHGLSYGLGQVSFDRLKLFAGFIETFTQCLNLMIEFLLNGRFIGRS